MNDMKQIKKKEVKKRMNIMITDSQRKKAKKIGKGSYSAGIGKALDGVE